MAHSIIGRMVPGLRVGKGLFTWPILIGLATSMLGCNANSFLDPSRTGRFEFFPTTIPILERIDVIEEPDDYWTNATPPAQEDLLPRDLTYHIFPGDLLTVRILGLYEPQIWENLTRRVDASGNFNVPQLGGVRAAGLTPEQFRERVRDESLKLFTTRPQVDVVVEQSGGLRYTVYGFVQNVGQYSLDNPNLRLLDALAIAGGVPLTTERIYVLRQVVLDERYDGPIAPPSTRMPQPDAPPDREPLPNIEDLIRDLERQENPGNGTVSPGMLQQAPSDDVEDEPQMPVDIDQLEPVREAQPPPPIDVDVLAPETRPSDDDSGESFIYVEERGEWVRVPRPGEAGQEEDRPAEPAVSMSDPNLVLDRVIEIDYRLLSRGNSMHNIVIRPNDRIYIEGPIQGYVYIDGESARPGVYSLPGIGRLTLSRFIAASGGLGPIAIPERVDLIRVVGNNREAKIRLDLAAIRAGTEPDIYMKPDDHIIIGTTFWATPLAIIRNGFRATYGFGFLLDRNFGTDVFGAPPDGGLN